MKEEKDKKKRKVAAAVRYDADKNLAPKVTAKGFGVVAEKIIERAVAANIPLREDPDLAQALAKLPLGEEIPANLYKAIAEILAFLYKLNGKIA